MRLFCCAGNGYSNLTTTRISNPNNDRSCRLDSNSLLRISTSTSGKNDVAVKRNCYPLHPV